MPVLTVSMQHYLKTIYVLSRLGDGVRICDIARERNVSKASACNAVKTLIEKGMATKSANHRVFLTEEGMDCALSIQCNYNAMVRFFADVIGIDEEAAVKEACALEHILTKDVLDAFSRFMQLYQCGIKSLAS